MLSWSFYLVAGAQREPLAHAHNAGRQGLLAKAREASRGRRRTPSNTLKGLENSPLRPVVATSRFFLPAFVSVYRNISISPLRFSRMSREYPETARQVTEAQRESAEIGRAHV